MKKLLLLTPIILCLMLVVSVAMAQPIMKCTEYKSGGIMDHTRVSSYVQDSKGILWMGSWIGLCRYDGREFHYFKEDANAASGTPIQPLGSNRILKIVLDSRENIWCQNYDKGLYRFDRETSAFQSVLPLVKDYPAVQALKDKVYVMQRNHVVWAVLADGTLVRFQDADPAQNEVLPCEPGEQNRTVYEIREDSRGREWILTNQGVILYGKGKISSFPYARFVEREGHCYLVSRTSVQFVEYMDDGSLQSIQLPTQVSLIHSVRTHGSQILLGTDQGLAVYDCTADSFRLTDTVADGSRTGEVFHTYADAKDRIWVFNKEGGIFCLKPGGKDFFRLANPDRNLPKLNESGKLYLIFEDAYGVVWVKPAKGELCWFDESDSCLHSYREAMALGETLPIQNYNFCFTDQQHNLWVSSGTRLYHLTFARRQFHSVQTDLNVEIRSLLEEDSLHVWYGDKSGLLCRRNLSDNSCRFLSPDGQWTTWKVPFTQSGIFSLLQTHDGQILLGSRGDGLFRLVPKPDGFRITRCQASGNGHALNCDIIYDMYQDEHDRVWIATFGGGLNLIENVKADTLRFLNGGNLGFPINTFEMTRCVQGDGKGRILVGTNKGLVAFSSDFDRLSDLRFQAYQAQTEQHNPLPDNMIMRVLCTSDGSFYLSSYPRGLCRVEGEGIDGLEFRPLPNRDYPAGDVNVTAIALSSGNIWTVAECGITCYNPKDRRMQYFDEHNFDRPYSMTECKPLELSDGRLLLGMFGGILVFDAGNMQKSDYTPKIVFTERRYSIGSEPYEQSLNDLDTLYVNPDQRSFSLHFAAVDFVPSRLVRYAYWMHAEDASEEEQWIYAGSPVVNFTNLAPGRYELHLKSTNSDGVWSANERVLCIQVMPTFWERWGWILWLLLGSVALGIAIFLYVRHLIQRQRSVAKQEISAVKIDMLTHPASQLDQEFIRNVMDYLTEHLSDGDLQVNDVADAMNMSRATFYRRLKQAADLSPNDFIHQVRMRQAAERLVTTNDPVSTIAYSVGFNNPKYFSKCFRQDYDMSPLEYRQQARAKAETQAADEE